MSKQPGTTMANVDAERAILGAILLDNAKYYELSGAFSGEEFSLDSHRRIYGRIHDLIDSQRAADIVTVSEELRQHQQLESIGGVAYRASLTDGVAVRTSILHYVSIVREKAALRRAIHLADAVRRAAIAPGADISEIAARLSDAGRELASQAAPRLVAVPGPLGPLLDDVAVMVRRYVYLSPAAAVVIASWIAVTHALDAVDSAAYLAITSPEKRSGKTRLLEVLELLVARPWLTGHVTAACLVRKIDAEQPTLLLDESDAAFAGDKEYAEALRGVLNTGHRRGGVASCCVGKGADTRFKDFATFCPKAIAGIGKLPDTVSDRAIPIRLQRQSRDERVVRFRRRAVEPEATGLRNRIASWAAANVGAVREACPALPEALSDRQQDGAEPLLAIADLAGESYGKMARAALVELLGGAAGADESLSVRLLSDIREAFEGHDRIRSADLVARLVSMEASPWPELNHGKPITPTTLARLLRKFDIGPRLVWSDGEAFRGYLRDQFADPWGRYLPCKVLHPLEPAKTLNETPFSKCYDSASLTPIKSEESSMSMRLVTPLTLQGPPAREQVGDNSEVQQ